MLNIIKPVVEKNQCYKNCFEFLKLNPSWTLVHGIASLQGRKDGVRYGHAWVELKITNPLALNPKQELTVVYDPSADIAVDKASYYEAGRIGFPHGEVFRYSYKKALTLAAKHETVGPWEKSILRAASLETHTLDGKKKKRGERDQ